MSTHSGRSSIKENFGYDPADENAILRRANSLVGLSIQDIIKRSPFKAVSMDPKNKGSIGNIIQYHGFGVEENSLPEPDFAEAGVELKVVPLEVRDSGLTVKERTKVCSINYTDLIEQQWFTSHAKTKLNKVLFIYFTYDGENRHRSKVEFCDLWHMNGPDEWIIKKDWEDVKGEVDKGNAHLLSESLTKVLAACRTGKGKGRDLVEQPKSTIKANKRAFALKQSFTKQLWLEICKKIKYESIIGSLRIKEPKDFEDALLEQMRTFTGMSLGEFSKKFGIDIPEGKNAAATIVKRALGFKNVNSHIKEFDQFGIEIRVVPVRSIDNRPWEAVSFPTFKIKELLKEEFEGSLLYEYVDRILFIPISREEKKTPMRKRIIGKPFFWSPSRSQWDTIEREWSNYQKEIRSGKCKITKIKSGKKYKEVTGLTKESGTNIIHVRPHGKDRTDRDTDTYGNSVVKQSFWLNKDLVWRLIKENSSYPCEKER